MVRGQMPYGLSEAEIEWVREGYRMFREGDPAFMDRFEPDAKFIFPATLPSGGTYDGAFAALEFWTTVAGAVRESVSRPGRVPAGRGSPDRARDLAGRSAQTGDEFGPSIRSLATSER